MLSFGDTISLLVTFFVMLIAFSDMEEAKLLELIGALKGGFRVTLSVNQTLGTNQNAKRLEKNVGAAEGQTLVARSQLSKLAAHEMLLQKRFSANTIGSFDKGYVLRLLDEGLSFIIRTDSLFDKGKAELLPKKDDVLGVVADLALDLSNEIRLVGVTPEDLQVLSSKSKTPWGLAAERALTIKQALVDKMGFDSSRFSIGARVEGEGGNLIHRKETFPSDRMEIVIVGYRDLSKISPEEAIINDRWK
jgi:chemotaxis protein MotB